jgi:hypothetical protein
MSDVIKQVVQDKHDDPKLHNLEEGDSSRNIRKRRLTILPKVENKAEKSMEDTIIELGIRDGSINWMVIVAMSSWRFSDYSDVLINYFGENVVMEEGDAVETNTKHADGPDCEKRGPTHKMVSTGPKQNTLKTKGWFWIRKGHSLHPNLRFVASAADVRWYSAGERTVVRVMECLYDSRSFATVVKEGVMNCEQNHPRREGKVATSSVRRMIMEEILEGALIIALGSMEGTGRAVTTGGTSTLTFT